MQIDHELISKLTSEGAEFESTWASFMFNMTQVKVLKEKASKDDVLQVLAAGTRFSGTGWSTGKASKAFRKLTGCSVVRSTIVLCRCLALCHCSHHGCGAAYT